MAPRDMQMRGDLVLAACLTARNLPKIRIDSLIERRDAAHVEGYVGEVGLLASQRRDDPVDGGRDTRTRPQLTGFRK
jgi:hypothetical protein